MGKLASKIRQTTKQGKMFPATIIDRGGGKASVRLSGNGATYQQLPLIGGQVSRGDLVYVDFNTDPPQVITTTETEYDEATDRTRWREIPRQSSMAEDSRKIRRYANGVTLVEMYDADETGMDAALTDAEVEDLILLPAITLTMDVPVPARVTVAGDNRYVCIINGGVTMSLDSKLNRLTVAYVTSGSDPGDIYGVTSYGTCLIDDCDIHACGCSSGSAGGIYVQGGVTTVRNSYVTGESAFGGGLAVRVDSGQARLYETTVYATTTLYVGESMIYVHGTLEGQAYCDCTKENMTGSSYLINEVSYGQMILPWQTGATLGVETDLPHIFTYDTLNNSVTFQDLGTTENYLFFSTSEGYVYRVNTSGSSWEVLNADPTPSNANGVRISIYDDDIVYVVYHETVDNDIVLAKLDFNLDTRTEIDRWTDTTTWNTVSYEFTQTAWLARHRYGNKQVLVMPSIWAGATEGDAIRIMRYDITTGSNPPEIDFYRLMGAAEEPISTGSSFLSTPRGYQNKLAFTALIPTFNGVSVDCPYPTYVVDIDDLSVTKVVRNSDLSLWGGGYAGWGSGVDQYSGIYYYWVEDVFNTATPNVLLSINLNDLSAGVTIEKYAAYNCLIVQGDTTPYALEDFNGSPDKWNLRNVPSLTEMNILTTDQSGTFVDETEGVIWQMSNEGTVKGFSLVGQGERTLTFTNDTGYAYALGRSFGMFLLYSGTIVRFMKSNNGGSGVQHEIGLFGTPMV